MNIKPRTQKLMAEINITPFTDVILVLLIIFMVTTPLMIQSRIQIQLPQAVHADPTEALKKQANVTITREGLIYLNESLVTKAELKTKMTAAHEANLAPEVFISSDKDVRFRDIIAVMDILKAVGINKLSLVTNQKQ